MAVRNFTPRPAIVRGSLVQALQGLEAKRMAALATMRAIARDPYAFAGASKEEATLAAQIRRLKRHRNGRDVPLTAEDKAILIRISERQEREYRIADRTDAEVLLLRLARGGVLVSRIGRVQS